MLPGEWSINLEQYWKWSGAWCLILSLLYDKVLFLCNFSTEYNTVWYLLNVNNICDLRMSWRKTKWVMYNMPSLKLSSIFYWKVTLNNFAQQLCLSYHNIVSIRQSILETSINKKMLMKYLKLKFFLAVIWILQSGLLLVI